MKNIVYFIFLAAFLMGCINKSKTELVDLDCEPFLSSPRFEWQTLNDCQLNSGNLASSLYMYIDSYGPCIDDNTVFSVFADFYDLSGNLTQTLSFDTQKPVLDGHIRLTVCLRYGTKAQHIKLRTYCIANNKVSNTVFVNLPRPLGAN